MTMNAKSIIYAVDDEASIRELYTCALENAGLDIRCYADGDELFAAIENKIPDLILLDIMLEGADGYEILQAIRKNAYTEDLPVIMVSAKGEEISKVKGLNLGADDYLAKPFGVMELTARINANLRKRGVKTSLSYKDITVDELAHEILIGGNKQAFTLKEYALLKLLVANANKVLSREEILNSVWGENYYGETRTLDIHIAMVRKKLENSTAEISTVRGVGYILK